jgi:hypothetical protein
MQAQKIKIGTRDNSQASCRREDEEDKGGCERKETGGRGRTAKY